MSVRELPGAGAASLGRRQAGGLGLLVAALAGFLPLVSVKPNRVATALPLSLGDLAGSMPVPGTPGTPGLQAYAPLIGLIAALLPLGLLALGLGARILPWLEERVGEAADSGAAGAVLGACGLALALGARFALAQGDFYTVNAGPGLWLALVGAWFLADAWLGARRSNWVSMLVAAMPGLVFFVVFAPLEHLAVAREFLNRRQRFGDEVLRHLALVVWPCLAAGALGFSGGVSARRRPRLRALILGIANGIQVLPSLALFGLLMAPLAALARALPPLREAGISGSGAAPALIALGAYAVLPMLRNTIAGFDGVPPEALDSGRGMGMDTRRLFLSIELPLALPLVVRGLRTAFVQGIGNAAVAALIGAGGLGVFVFQGLGEAAPDLVMLGVLPLLGAATLGDRAFQALENLVRSRGLGQAG